MSPPQGPGNSNASPRPRWVELFLDKEGRWFHEGVEVTHARTCRMFYANLHRAPDGTYWVEAGGERARVTVEDAPYTVRAVSVDRDAQDRPLRYRLVLADDTEEALDPETLRVGSGNVLYCRVKNGTERARFLRPAYYHLCRHIGCEEESERYWLPLGGKRVYIHLPG